MDKIFFLIDTNIFIQLEDNEILKDAFTKFHSLCNENFAVICIHPLTIEDLQNDNNPQRKEKVLSKIKKYRILERPPIAEEHSLKNLFGLIKSTNDKIDCQLLYALQRHTVSFLITEDIGIHQRAKNASIRNKVLTINQANNTLERLFPKQIEISLPKIETEFLYSINSDDKIFDNLREDYIDFQKWFEKCSEEQVKAWTIKNSSNELESICIYKEAKEDDYINYNLPQKSLKLATFKVAESHRGKKLGELMLKQAFFYSVTNQFKSCWMTVFPKHKILIDLIKDFGFDEIAETDLKDKGTKETELVFQKYFTKPGAPQIKGLDYHIKYFPFYDDSSHIKKYIIPIQERYYHILFPEKNLQMSLPIEPIEEDEIPGNTIKKVYLCHAPIKQLKCNDLVFFYVSTPVQAITSIGIIESVFRSNELLEVVSLIGKRSVYSFEEIKKMTNQRVLVIEFRFIKHFKQKIKLSNLIEQKIIQGAPQSIQNFNNYEKFKSNYSDM